MDSLGRPRLWVQLGAVALGLTLLYQFWHWEVERIEVPPGHFLVRIHLWGKDLPEGDIIAPDESYKGVLEQPLKEGRHFLNPLLWSHEIAPLLYVPPGKCLVLTRKFGKEIPGERLAAGDILAREGERGIVRDVLLAGNYRLNPHAYAWEQVDAIEIRAGQVGVRTLKVGRDPRTLPADPNRSLYLVPDGYRGVQEKTLTNGTYYVNPHVESIVPVDVSSRRVEFSGIQFPSRDGFTLRPHVLVTYRVLPEHAAELLVQLTHAGELHQQDATPQQQEGNEVLQKVVLPFIRGYVRIQGSKFDARDFVSAVREAAPRVPARGQAVNPRERLQRELMEKVVPRCQKHGIAIESITLAQMDVPPELAEQISARELARVQREKNLQMIEQYRSEQSLKSKAEAFKQQQKEVVEANKKLQVMQKSAQQRTEVEEAKLKQDLTNAKLRLEAARAEARGRLLTGKAEADVIHLQNEAQVSGLRKAVQGFPSADAYAQYEMLSRLAPALREIFASDSGDFARVFANYLTPTTKASGGAAGKVAATSPEIKTVRDASAKQP